MWPQRQCSSRLFSAPATCRHQMNFDGAASGLGPGCPLLLLGFLGFFFFFFWLCRVFVVTHENFSLSCCMWSLVP